MHKDLKQTFSKAFLGNSCSYLAASQIQSITLFFIDVDLI